VKKIALVFALAVFVPSLLLAWLAVRSLRDQQLVLERQQSLLYQEVADSLAKAAEDYLSQQQHEFGQQVETLLAKQNTDEVAVSFDDRLRTNWPAAEVGFVVTMNGRLVCPSPFSRPAAQVFCADNAKFLCNIESVEVYYNSAANATQGGSQNALLNAAPNQGKLALDNNNAKSIARGQQFRSVIPQQQQLQAPSVPDPGNYSKVAASEAEFRELIGDSREGAVARFLENKLCLLLWYRSPADDSKIFGAQLSLARLKMGLAPIPQKLDPAFRDDIGVALLDEGARPVGVFPAGFQANWKRPFVATEVGEELPHWEMAAYLLDPAKLARSAQALRLTLGSLIALLLLAIAAGGWLIVADLRRQLLAARQKTDFVSNVSHELKTPLTSIRMFSELLAEGRVNEPAKRQSYLNIITAETSRLTRLINNVLDFSRMERGEKRYSFKPCDLIAVARETLDTYRPHLESCGFKIESRLPNALILVNGDRDALSQVIVNLLSNAEKYSSDHKEVLVEIERRDEPLPHVEVRVQDRGLGVPRGCEMKIFEQFYRAHDSLASGIQGSGLGLTLGRQIARAHGGEVVYRAREGGGSCFALRLPIAANAEKSVS
jgi:signal transduction histidine kinase